jgi:hypothetical protein
MLHRLLPGMMEREMKAALKLQWLGPNQQIPIEPLLHDAEKW